MDWKLGETNSLGGPHEQHSNAWYDKQRSSSGSFTKEWCDKCDNKIPNLKNAVNKQLSTRAADTELIENFVLIVTDKTISGPLGEKSEGDNDSDSTEVAGGLKETEVADLRGLAI